LAALKDFYNDKDTRQKHFEDLKSKAENEADDRQWSMEDFSEDWQTSQFWVNSMHDRCLEGSRVDSMIV